MDCDDKNLPKFTCDYCDYTTFKMADWKKHVQTKKHQKSDNLNILNKKVATPEIKKFSCKSCNKEYKARNSLWYHEQKCIQITPENVDSKLILQLIQQNDNFKQLLVDQNKMIFEQQKQMVEISKISQTNTTNNYVNSHNKTFNLQLFLNDTCKDAMNIMDFVESIQLQLTDLEGVGKEGFVQGISNIIMKNLKALDVTKRPVHCSDHKREIMYVKDQNQWFNDSKEQPNNQKLTNAIKQIAHRNICMIPQWKAKYPDCIYSDSKKSDQYNHIIYESMDYSQLNSEKIIKKIAKEVIIDKN